MKTVFTTIPLTWVVLEAKTSCKGVKLFYHKVLEYSVCYVDANIKPEFAECLFRFVEYVCFQMLPSFRCEITWLLMCTGEEARKLFNDAQTMLSDIVEKKQLSCSGVVGFYRAQSIGDDIELLDDNGDSLCVLHGLRQQVVMITIPTIIILTLSNLIHLFIGILHCTAAHLIQNHGK